MSKNLIQRKIEDYVVFVKPCVVNQCIVIRTGEGDIHIFPRISLIGDVYAGCIWCDKKPLPCVKFTGKIIFDEDSFPFENKVRRVGFVKKFRGGVTCMADLYAALDDRKTLTGKFFQMISVGVKTHRFVSFEKNTTP